MTNKISHTNISFGFLKGSPEFLDLVLNNISSCILLLDRQMELQAFNNVLTSIFSNKKNEDLLYARCGEAIGCAYNVEEMKRCGETSHCSTCDLRAAALISYYKNQPVFKEKVSREFYKIDGQKEWKHLQFSTRCFDFEKERYIIMIVDDITRLVNDEERLRIQDQQIKALKAKLLKNKN